MGEVRMRICRTCGRSVRRTWRAECEECRNAGGARHRKPINGLVNDRYFEAAEEDEA